MNFWLLSKIVLLLCVVTEEVGDLYFNPVILEAQKTYKENPLKASSQKLEPLLTLKTFTKGKQVSQDESTHDWFEGCSQVCQQTCFSLHMFPIKYCNGFNIKLCGVLATNKQAEKEILRCNGTSGTRRRRLPNHSPWCWQLEGITQMTDDLSFFFFLCFP